MNPIDSYVVRYITEFLKQCDMCKRYDINNYINTCCMCSDFYCEKCCKDLQYRGYHDETMRKYCKKCEKRYFHC